MKTFEREREGEEGRSGNVIAFSHGYPNPSFESSIPAPFALNLWIETAANQVGEQRGLNVFLLTLWWRSLNRKIR